MEINIINKISEIYNSDIHLIYDSFRSLFSEIKLPFCKFELIPERGLLYRVRSHTDGDGNYFYDNVCKLSFRQDVEEIKTYGRCNKPRQSRFYASDNEQIAFTEVSEILKTENVKETVYHTTSAWKVKKGLLISPILESASLNVNQELKRITEKCYNEIESEMLILKKDELKEYLIQISDEFTKPFSTNLKTYLFSAAYSEYLFETVGSMNENIDGIVYPTCLPDSTIRNKGLNFVFRNSVVGFANKIEFYGAYRSKLEKIGFKEYKETERIKSKNVNPIDGEIEW